VQSTSAVPVDVICVSHISFAAAEVVVVVVEAAARLFWRMFFEANADEVFIMMMLWSTRHW